MKIIYKFFAECKKIPISVFALVLIVGCASTNLPRPEFYNTTGGERAKEAIGSVSWVTAPIGGSSKNARYLRVYPECADKNTSEADLMECVKEIDINEGRVKREKLERPNMDEIRK